jgi:hypothetical protein
MRKTMTLFLSMLAALLIAACGRDTIDLNGHAIFMAEGAVIRYAAFSGNEKPRFHSIRSMKSLPNSADIEIVDVVPVSSRDLLVITRRHGLYKITSLGERCGRIDRGLPPEVVYPFTDRGVTKPVLHHSVSGDAKRVAVIVPNAAYLSVDGGHSFVRLGLAGVTRFTELLSVALHPVKENLIVIGTASNGIYYSRDGGITARRIKAGMPGEPSRTPNFLEEIRSVCFGDDDDTFYAGLGNGGGVYRGSLSRGVVEAIGDSGLRTYPGGDFYRVTSVNHLNGNLFIGTNRKWRKILSPGAPKEALPVNAYIRDMFLNNDAALSAHSGGSHFSFLRAYQPRREFEPDKRALGRKAMYISYSFTQNDNYGRLLRLLRYLKLNAVVINLKDDYGSIRVPVTDPFVKQVPGSVNPYINVLRTIKRLRSDGIYVIARQVCFKDDKVYGFRENKYAVKNAAGFPFHKGPEKWVDGFSEFVWDYNIAVAKELEKAGVDEIQFDYIRFPDIRGENDNRRFDFMRDGQSMREALVSFLKKARGALRVPISVDIFGYTAIYQWGDWIGQDVTELSRYADVISPMFYPSHYTGGYAAGYGAKRIYYTIYLSGKRARELSGGAVIRPYVQAFYYKDNADGYCVDYIGWELDGLADSGMKDYIFWNDLSEYTVLIRGLRKYRGMGDGPLPPSIREYIPKKLPFDSMVEMKDRAGTR